MFRFKDSNFYLNQVCVPDARCHEELFDGARVAYDPINHALTLDASGDYIVLGEQLNRDVVIDGSDHYIITRGVHLLGDYVRVFRLENLVGLEFVTDRIDAPSVGAYYNANAVGEIVEEGAAEIRFLCTDVSANIATLVCVKDSIDR